MAETPDREFLSIFLVEAWDTVATLEEGLGRLRQPQDPREGAPALAPLVVVSHRLKGAAALHGFPGLADVAGALENLLERLPALPPSQRAGAADFLVDLVDLLKKVFDGIGASGRENGTEILAFKARHAALFAPAVPSGWPPGGTTGGPGGLRADLDRFFADNTDILTYFGPEAAEHLETMTKALLALEQRGRDEDELATLFRAVHTLKGAAYTVGCGVVGDLAHRVEDLLAGVREGRVALTPSVIEAVLASADALRLLLGIAEGAPGDLEAVLQRAVEGLDRLAPAEEAEPADRRAPIVAETAPAVAAAATLPAAVETASAREPAPAEGRPAVRAGVRVNLDRLDALMDLVGELVIARSRLDRRLRELDRIGELLHVSRSRMARAVKDFETRHPYGSLSPSGPAAVPAPDPEPGASASVSQLFAELEFDRYDDLDILARSVGEMSADLGEVQTQLAGLIRTIWEDTGQIQRLTGSLRNEVTRARMVPVGRLFGRFARHVREAARTAGKTVVLQTSGEAVEVDNTVIEHVSDPVLHLIQNAIAHGIEPEAERRERGKPAHGTVYLSAAHRGGFVYIEVEDDGRGIDAERIKEQAVRQEFLRSDEAGRLSARGALDLMFLPGFSTAAAVTTAAGRGVGLDVVRTNVSRLNGEIEVETEPGVGTRFTLKLPLTVVISDALMVRVGAEALAVPLNAVRLIVRVRPDEIQAVGRAEMVRLDGELVELFRLDRLLALPPGESRPPAPTPVPIVVLRAGGRSIAVAVDELGGKEEIVIKGLGGFPEGVGAFTGATISGEGRVVLLIDAGRLVELTDGTVRGVPAAGRRRGEEPTRSRAAADGARRVLLVDDSISVRRFVGHMLERAGFRVLTANDGAEALQQLGETAVDVVVTDLEMPRVNGYELIEDLRRRPSTRDVPVVVLTTRAGDKHLSLARRLGVEHYVSKPVDEERFVRLIASLAAPAVAGPALSGVVR